MASENSPTPADFAGDLIRLARSRRRTLAAAESCTGGLIAAALTTPAGASAVFLGGMVAYTNPAKTELLGVDPDFLEKHGAVSERVAAAMAQGAAERLGADIAVATTGYAGPTGGKTQPAGTVYIAVSDRGRSSVTRHLFPGDRDAVRTQATLAALAALRDRVERA